MVSVIQDKDTNGTAAVVIQILIQLFVLLLEGSPGAWSYLVGISGHYLGAISIPFLNGPGHSGLPTAWQPSKDEESLALTKCIHSPLIRQERELEFRLVLGS